MPLQLGYSKYIVTILSDFGKSIVAILFLQLDKLMYSG